MIKFMINYVKMKRKECELKLAIYTYLTGLIGEKEHIIELIQNLYLGLKDASAEELSDLLVKEIASLVHDSTHGDTVDKQSA